MKRRRLALAFLAALLCGLAALPAPDAAAAELQLDVYAPADSVARPMVLIVQGTGAVGGRETGWAEWFRERGLVAVVLHSAKARGLKSFSGSRISDYSKDIVTALSLLEGDRRVDAQRFAIIGFSRGGSVALLAGKHFQGQQVAPALVFAFYPGSPSGCFNEHGAATEVHIFYGTADEWGNFHGLLNACRKLQNEHVFFHEFPGVHHGFDGVNTGSFRSGDSGSREFHMAPDLEATAAARGIINEALVRVWGDFQNKAGQ